MKTKNESESGTASVIDRRPVPVEMYGAAVATFDGDDDLDAQIAEWRDEIAVGYGQEPVAKPLINEYGVEGKDWIRIELPPYTPLTYEAFAQERLQAMQGKPAGVDVEGILKVLSHLSEMDHHLFRSDYVGNLLGICGCPLRYDQQKGVLWVPGMPGFSRKKGWRLGVPPSELTIAMYHFLTDTESPLAYSPGRKRLARELLADLYGRLERGEIPSVKTLPKSSTAGRFRRQADAPRRMI